MDKVRKLLLSGRLPKLNLFVVLVVGLFSYTYVCFDTISFFLERGEEQGRPNWLQDLMTCVLTLVSIYMGYWVFSRAYRKIQKLDKEDKERGN